MSGRQHVGAHGSDDAYILGEERWKRSARRCGRWRGLRALSVPVLGEPVPHDWVDAREILDPVLPESPGSCHTKTNFFGGWLKPVVAETSHP